MTDASSRYVSKQQQKKRKEKHFPHSISMFGLNVFLFFFLENINAFSLNSSFDNVEQLAAQISLQIFTDD